MSDHPLTALAAVSLASGITATSGRPHTEAEAVATWRAVLADLHREGAGE